jgi:hypothetical protein
MEISVIRLLLGFDLPSLLLPDRPKWAPLFGIREGVKMTING